MTTVILGLGSSLNDRLANLRRALRLLREIEGLEVQCVSPVYLSDALLPENAPPEWNVPYLNLAIRCEVKQTPENLLKALKLTEQKAGRLPEKKWGPRIIDIDLLAYGTHVQRDAVLHVPHAHLASRPFALWPLADVSPEWCHPETGMTAAEMVKPFGSRFTGEAPFRTRQILQRIDTPELVGILNLTPDSFSDGGRFDQRDALLAQAEKLAAEGASVLDLGAEATHPEASPLTADEEWQRLKEILPDLLKVRSSFIIPPLVSVDTRHVSTAEKALALGVDWINDVSGLTQPEMRQLIAHAGCKVVFMHQLGLPARRDMTLPAGCDPVSEVMAFAEGRIREALEAGILRENLIFDPGIGFGKTAIQSLSLLKNIAKCQVADIPLMVGHSRKSFFSHLSPASASERDPETLAISVFLTQQKVDFLRIHNAGLHAKYWQALASFASF